MTHIPTSWSHEQMVIRMLDRRIRGLPTPWQGAPGGGTMLRGLGRTSIYLPVTQLLGDKGGTFEGEGAAHHIARYCFAKLLLGFGGLAPHI